MTISAPAIATLLALTGSADATATLGPENTSCPEGACGALAGAVRLAGTREPLEGVRVALLAAGWSRETTTDAEGRFALSDLPLGDIEIVVVREGIRAARIRATIIRGATVEANVWAVRDEDTAYRTVVRARPPTTSGGARRLSLELEEARTSPGTQGDALRAVQNLPGVARPPAGLGLLVLRGAPPGESLTLLGEHPVPRAFHTLPFAGIVQSEALDGIDVIPSAASARYGPITGGVVVMRPRRPRRRVHGHGQIDLTGANAAVEGPLGRAAYLVAARRGWIDGVLRAVEKVDPLQARSLPRMWDYQGWVVTPIRSGEVEVRLLGAGDRVSGRTYDRYGQRVVTTFQYDSQFHRLDLVGRWRLGRTRFLLTPSFRYQADVAEDPEDIGVEHREYATSIRAEMETPVGSRASLLVGADAIVSPYGGRTRSLRESPLSGESAQSVRSSTAHAGAYAIVHLGDARWRISPGVRVQGFLYSRLAAAAVDPRLTSRVTLTDRVSLQLATGQYSRPAVPIDGVDGDILSMTLRDLAPTVVLPGALTNSFEPSVPSTAEPKTIRVIVAYHASATMRVELPWELQLDVGAFGRLVRDPGSVSAPGPSSPAEELAEPSRGHDVGGELLLRKRLTRRLYGWVAYTVMRTRREIDGARTPSDFDQPHNLAVVVSHGLPRGWRLGARFRVVSGNPYRPVTGAIDVDPSQTGGGRTLVLYGTRNSARLPTFHQLDVRVDKRWVLNRAEIAAYVDVQNVYNHENVEAWIYQGDYREKRGGLGLPIFPTLGVRVDW